MKKWIPAEDILPACLVTGFGVVQLVIGAVLASIVSRVDASIATECVAGFLLTGSVVSGGGFMLFATAMWRRWSHRSTVVNTIRQLQRLVFDAARGEREAALMPVRQLLSQADQALRDGSVEEASRYAREASCALHAVGFGADVRRISTETGFSTASAALARPIA